MKIISHRGNLEKSNVELENTIPFLEKAIEMGYEVETDIWYVEKKLYLGHNGPTSVVSVDWLLTNKNKLWIHCKHQDSLFYLKNFSELNIFYHDNDPFTITSKNIILINPFFETNYYDGILMMPEYSKVDIQDVIKFKGIFTDKVTFYEDYINNVGK